VNPHELWRRVPWPLKFIALLIGSVLAMALLLIGINAVTGWL
jgi:hypothetical protein